MPFLNRLTTLAASYHLIHSIKARHRILSTASNHDSTGKNEHVYESFPYAGSKLSFTEKFKIVRVLWNYIEELNKADGKYHHYNKKKQMFLKMPGFPEYTWNGLYFRILSLGIDPSFVAMVRDDSIVSTVALHLQSSTMALASEDIDNETRIKLFLSLYKKAENSLAIKTGKRKSVGPAHLQVPASVEIHSDYYKKSFFIAAGVQLTRIPMHLLSQDPELRQAAIATSYRCVDIWHHIFDTGARQQAIHHFWWLTEFAPDSPESRYLHALPLACIDGLFTSILEPHYDLFPTFKDEIDDIIAFLRCMIAASWFLRQGDHREAHNAYHFADIHLAKISTNIIQCQDTLLELAGGLLYRLAKEVESYNLINVNSDSETFNEYKRRFFELIDPKDPPYVLFALISAFEHLPLSKQKVRVCYPREEDGVWPPFAEPLSYGERVVLSEENLSKAVVSSTVAPVSLSSCQSTLFAASPNLPSGAPVTQGFENKDTVETIGSNVPRSPS